MKPVRCLYACAALALAAAAVSVLPGCAGKKNVWGDPESGLILEYRMKPGDVLKYRLARQGTERVEVMGQSNESVRNTTIEFTAESKGMEDGKHLLGITVESLEATMKSIQGEFSADATGVIGKSFDMILSPLGKEVDLPGAEGLKYTIGPLGENSIRSDFESVFADLAGRPVKVGDSWTSTDTVNIEQGNVDLVIISENVNTLDGFETVDGLDCARVAVDVTGTITGTGEQMGAPLVFDGTMAGAETWYFAYKQGYFVKSSSDLDTDMMVTVQTGQEMNIPVKGTVHLETTLLK